MVGLILRLLFCHQALVIGLSKAQYGNIKASALLAQRTDYQVIDFQSDYQRELNGYVAESTLHKEDENITVET